LRGRHLKRRRHFRYIIQASPHAVAYAKTDTSASQISFFRAFITAVLAAGGSLILARAAAAEVSRYMPDKHRI
jgi:hypothetical protein